MYLEPVRRPRHYINKMDTFALHGCNNLLITVNADVITYEIAVDTGMSRGPPTLRTHP